MPSRDRACWSAAGSNTWSWFSVSDAVPLALRARVNAAVRSVCGAGAGLPELTTAPRPRASASAPLTATAAVACTARLR